MFIQVQTLDECEDGVRLSFLALTLRCRSKSASQSSRAPAMTESESADETIVAETGMTFSLFLREIQCNRNNSQQRRVNPYRKQLWCSLAPSQYVWYPQSTAG